jgi:hypothetical protein
MCEEVMTPLDGLIRGYRAVQREKSAAGEAVGGSNRVAQALAALRRQAAHVAIRCQQMV